MSAITLGALRWSAHIEIPSRGTDPEIGVSYESEINGHSRESRDESELNEWTTNEPVGIGPEANAGGEAEGIPSAGPEEPESPSYVSSVTGMNADADDDSDAPIRLDDAAIVEAESDDPSGDTGSDTGSDADDESDADVRADHVEIHNGGARDVDANSVTITQGGARDVDAATVTINQGGAARIRADELNVSQGGVGLARTDQFTIQQGGSAFAVVADSATVEEGSSVFLLVAGSTNGDVRPVLDWRAAAALGAGFAVLMSILRRGRRR